MTLVTQIRHYYFSCRWNIGQKRFSTWFRRCANQNTKTVFDIFVYKCRTFRFAAAELATNYWKSIVQFIFRPLIACLFVLLNKHWSLPPENLFSISAGEIWKLIATYHGNDRRYLLCSYFKLTREGVFCSIFHASQRTFLSPVTFSLKLKTDRIISYWFYFCLVHAGSVE